MCGLPWRLACCLAFALPTILPAQMSRSLAGRSYPNAGAAGLQQTRAESFLVRRAVGGQAPALLRMRGMQQRAAVPALLSGNQPWQPVGPNQIVTPQFGDVTGRVTSIAIAPWDASGNTVYLGSTGGGVWRSTNAAATDPTTVTFQPLTDDLSAYSGVNITSLSIGAVSVQPGSSPDGVVLAGTGDPNDALDSYYGAGILRSADGGATWSLITESNDGFSGGVTNYSFAGDAFSGFAWSTANPSLVVAAVTDSYDGFVNNVNNSNTDNVAEAGLYYSTDAGQTWYLSTIEDGPNQVIQSSQTTVPSVFPGVPVNSVVWNPVRQMFYAAVQYHGYYQSPDGVTWTRLANQPGAALTANNCPANPGFTGSNSCTIFRGVLAVQPNTGDMFALTVDVNGVDQGLWQDACNAGSTGACASSTVQFAVQVPDAALDDGNVAGTIPLGTYSLALAAVPNGSDTLLFAGTQDIFRCSLAAGCVWRNTTNATICDSGKVAPAQHAMAFLAPPAGQSLPLVFFGNDGGVWRSTDGVDQTGAACSASDATHFDNLNGGLGSLAEVTGLADSGADADVVLAGFGTNGSAATADLATTAWPQLASGEGGQTAIDPANPDNWYATLGPGVAIGQCTQGTNCTATDFGSTPAIGLAQTGNDQSLLTAPTLLDPTESANMIVGTCRVWRGAADGSGWSAANAISPMLDGKPEPSCNGNALIRSLAAGGANEQAGAGAQNDGAQVIYAGMAGLLDGGGANVPGHVFSTQAANLANSSTSWTDLALSPVANEQSYNGVFNPDHFDVSSLYVDPHDPTGNTVYATIQGFGVPHLYLSIDGGADWNNITKNLPDLPLNDVLVDPNDASVVYVASDGGVFVTQNVANCEGSGGQCWNVLGTGLPLAPAVALAATTAGGGLLRVGTYGRGIWQTPLLSGVPQTAVTVAPASLTFAGEPVGAASSAQTVTVTNTGSANLAVSNIDVTGDFSETDNCTGGSIALSATCQIQVTFTPSATGPRSGILTVVANISGGQQSVALAGSGTTQSAIAVLPNSVAFADQQVGTTSSAQQVTVSNTGGSSVALTSESVTGPFSISINSCSSSLDSNTGCTLAIVFQPTQTGAASGTMTIVTGQGTQTVPLTGNGDNPATDTLAPLSLIFPSTLEDTASAPQTVTLTNSGGAPLGGIQVQTTGDFTMVNGCGYSLNPQSSCTLAVRYAPHAAGAESGSITVTDALRTQIVQLSGTGVAPPTDTLSATALIFPVTVIGQSAPQQTFAMTNSGDSALTAIAIQAVGAGFGETNTCGATLAAHSSCVITATYKAESAGGVTGQIDVADELRTQVVSLSASGETPAEDNLSPLSIAFGAQAAGSVSAAQTVTLANNGQATLTGIREQSSNPDFMFTTTCGATLTRGSSCTILVKFSPQAPGPDNGTLTVIDASRSQGVQLTGAGTLANITLTPQSLNFGATGVRISSAAQTLVLSNGSTGTMSGLSLAIAGPYTETSTCGVALPSGESCQIFVTFLPGSAGMQTGSVTISSADTGAMAVPLAGAGIDYSLSLTSPSSVSVQSGQAAAYSLLLVPVNGSSGTVSVTCSNLPPNSTCTANPATASLLNSTTIQVAIGTGVGSSAARAAPIGPARIGRAGLAGSLPWPLGVLLLFVPLWLVRRRRKALPSAIVRVLTLLVLVAVIAGISACGKGGGPLGNGVPDPLPTSSLTPPGTYTATITATAGGLQKSVEVTVQVQ